MRNIRFLLFVAAAFLLAFSAPSYALDAYALLKDAGNVKNKPAFEGVQSLRFTKPDKTLDERIQFYFVNEKSFKAEILDPPDLKGTMFGRAGDMFNVYVPKFHFKMNQPTNDKDKGVAAQGDNLYIVGNWGVFKKNYNVTYVKDEKFLQMPVHKITITNKHSHFMKRNLWIDKKTHILMKEVRFFSGKPYYEFSYEKIQFKKPDAENLNVASGGKGISAPQIKRDIFLKLADAKPHFPFQPFYPSKLPGGFAFKDARIRQSMFGKDIIFIFTDGLHMVRIEERKSGFLGGLGNLLRGIMDKFMDYSPTNTVKDKKEGVEINIIGEFPVDMLNSMFDSLKLL